MLLRALAPCLALAALPAGATEPSAREVARRCVAAYGGTEAIARASGFVQEGTVTSLLHPGLTGRIGRAYRRPGRLRVEIVYPDRSGEIRVLDGAEGWRDGAPASGPQLAAMVLHAARLDLPALLAEKGRRIADRGTWKHEGKTLRVLAVEVGPGMEVEAGIDPESGRILRSRSLASGKGREVEFVTVYSEFREVGGVLFAFREGNWANGATTGETFLSRVEVVTAAEDAGLFRP
ncbi:MAG TPA: hypothetical protein VLS93_16250 [Anaeromyxobacteraceae bacterium]|nr:hypothetical protein [Anaeromyxobacteraceae bacterium]